MSQLPTLPTGDGSWIVRLLETAGAAIFGGLVSLVAFRTKLALMDKEIADLKTEIKEQRADTERRHTENLDVWRRYMVDINRRQAMLLEIVAGIARKVGVDHRFSDVLVKFLNEEPSVE